MKYHYIYEIRTNNLCHGNRLLETCVSLKDAQRKVPDYQEHYGCCDIYKVREYV